MKKFLEIIKKKWLIDNTKTTILVAFLIIAFLFINIGVNKLDLQSIDVTRNKLYSLSDDTKNKISELNQNVSIYFFGIDDSYTIVDLAKQYSRINDKIEVLVVDSTQRPDLYEKYEVTDSSSQGIVVQAPERYKILSLNDLTEYDYKTNETVDVSEQKLTNAIIDTTIAKKPKIYFLSGHDESSDMQIFQTYLANEVNEVDTLNLLSSDFPDDCDLLFISNPQKDFADYETDEIIDYINNGGNILWLSNGIDSSYINIKKILALYGADIPKGVIRESNSNSTFASTQNYFAPTLSYHTITKSFITSNTSSPLIALFDSSKINTVSDEELSNLNVTATPFLKSLDTSYFRTDLTNTATAATDDEETGSFNIGIEFSKQINGNNSKLVLYSDVKFATDSLTIENKSIQPILSFYNNDLLLNTTAYLTEREDAITIRKSTDTVSYTATDSEDLTIRLIIFIIPLIIILLGIIVWFIRRYKK